VASVWIRTRPTLQGGKRYRVEFRLGGRESGTRYAGSFKTRAEAIERKKWVANELAARRVPDLGPLGREPARTSLAAAAERWRRSRVDVSEGTMETYRVAINRLRRRLGASSMEDIDAQAVAALVAELHADGLRKETIRKTIAVLAMILDHEGASPNPARDKLVVRMPREERRYVQPPTAEHVEAAVRLLPVRYRLPALVLDATGMRIGELEALTWGDVDEPRGRWRIATSKSGKPRWVSPPPFLYERALELCPRDDRVPGRPVFQGFVAVTFRVSLLRACAAAGVPSFSPHDLRHRRVSLLHLGGMPWARIAEHVGHGDLATTMRTYTHVVADEAELDYSALLG
jgi:integrase